MLKETALKSKKYIIVIVLFIASVNAFARWGINLGFRNPAYTNNGINFIYFESKWAFEFGLGIPAVSVHNDELSAGVLGDIDIKYFFARPFGLYVESGLRAHASTHGGANLKANVGVEAPFVGLGLYYKGQKVFIYGSGNYNTTYGDIYTAFGIGLLI